MASNTVIIVKSNHKNMCYSFSSSDREKSESHRLDVYFSRLIGSEKSPSKSSHAELERRRSKATLMSLNMRS